MNATIVRRGIAVCALISALVLSVFVSGEIAAAKTPGLDGIAHRWVTQQMGYAPYTELTPVERRAEKVAVAALVVPPMSVIGQADHGYAQPSALITLAKSLRDAKPVIIGHELLVWNGHKAARVYVSKEGLVKVVGTGTVQQMLVSPASVVTDQGDRDAYETAKAAFDAAHAVDRRVPLVAGGLVSAHAVGFAHSDGTHIVVRVGVDGDTSYPDW